MGVHKLKMNQPSGQALNFPKTEWALIKAAAKTNAPPVALERFLEQYLSLLETYITTQFWLSTEKARDWLQDFVLDKVIARELMRKADSSRGKFRNFLLRSLHNYIVQQMRREAARKRAPANLALPLHELPENQLGATDAEIRSEFDVAWARGVFAEALRRMRRDCRASHREDFWGVFYSRLLRPMVEEMEPLSYDDLVLKYRFQSRGEASNVLITGKRMFARQLREVVKEYARNETAVEVEIADLKDILLQAGADLDSIPHVAERGLKR